jgi:YVTN family beta-propeller protein
MVDRGSKTISVIDTVTTTVSTTIPVGGDPGAVAVSADGRRAYVTNGGAQHVTVINTEANTVTAEIKMSSPFNLPTMPGA